MDLETGKAPESFQGVLWFFRNWRKYKLQLIVCAFVWIVSLFFVPIGKKVSVLICSHFSSVTVKVIHFDHTTGEITLEFNNEKRNPVPIDSVYITIAPTNSIPLKPLPPDFQRLVSVFQRNAMRIPSGAGIEFGPISCKTEMKGRPMRMAVILMRDTPPIVLPPGLTRTNIMPRGTSFTGICDQFLEGAELEVILHTSLIDSKGLSHTQEIPLGTYFIGEHHTGLKGAPYPKEIDVLRGAKVGGSASERMMYSSSGILVIPPPDDKIKVAIMENVSPSDVLLSVGEDIRGLVPVIFIKKSILYGCQFRVEMVGNERLPPDFSAWVMTRDEGKTVMNVPMAFSDNWSNAKSDPTPGKEYEIQLPSTNWHVLIGGMRWARIEEGTIKYMVKEQTWLKLLPASDATASFLSSNYNRIALQEVSNDPSWTPVTNAPIIPTNSKTFLIMQNEVKPDLSVFSTLRLPDSSNTNVHTDNSPARQAKTVPGDSPRPP